MKLKESIAIAAPPENIWPMIAKRENVSVVDPLVKRFDFVGEQHSGVGTMFYMEKKTDGRLIRSLCTFTEWKESKKLAFHQILGGDVKKMYVAYTIEAIEKGSRVTLMHEIVMPYWIIGKIVELLIARPVMKKVGPEVLANIKRLAEA